MRAVRLFPSGGPQLPPTRLTMCSAASSRLYLVRRIRGSFLRGFAHGLACSVAIGAGRCAVHPRAVNAGRVGPALPMHPGCWFASDGLSRVLFCRYLLRSSKTPRYISPNHEILVACRRGRPICSTGKCSTVVRPCDAVSQIKEGVGLPLLEKMNRLWIFSFYHLNLSFSGLLALGFRYYSRSSLSQSG